MAGDVNAVPPLGIEGIKRSDFGTPLIHTVNAQGAVGVGALAVGDVKYKMQHTLLKLMLETDKPLYLDFRDAFNKARENIKSYLFNPLILLNQSIINMSKFNSKSG